MVFPEFPVCQVALVFQADLVFLAILAFLVDLEYQVDWVLLAFLVVLVNLVFQAFLVVLANQVIQDLLGIQVLQVIQVPLVILVLQVIQVLLVILVLLVIQDHRAILVLGDLASQDPQNLGVLVHQANHRLVIPAILDSPVSLELQVLLSKLLQLRSLNLAMNFFSDLLSVCRRYPTIYPNLRVVRAMRVVYRD